jgi:hypothetical protein
MIAFQIPAKSRRWLILFVQKHSQNKKKLFFFIFFLYIPHTFNILQLYINNLAQRLSKDLLRSYFFY